MTRVTLLDQFIISRNDGSITAQELFEVNGVSHLYNTVYAESLGIQGGGERTRYVFIIRSYPKQTHTMADADKGKWLILSNRTYQKKGWAIRAFRANREHILKYRSVSP